MVNFDIKLLEELSNEFGPSGFEWEVQKKLKEYVKTYADRILQDRTECDKTNTGTNKKIRQRNSRIIYSYLVH